MVAENPRQSGIFHSLFSKRFLKQDRWIVEKSVIHRRLEKYGKNNSF
jgi:hypothetical protein